MQKVTLVQATKGRIGQKSITNNEGFISAREYVPNSPRRVIIRTARGVNSTARYERNVWVFDDDFAQDVRDWAEDNGI